MLWPKAGGRDPRPRPASGARYGLPAGTATGLVISGQFVSVDQGNRTERVVLGLGAGRSDVRVRVQAFDVTPQGRQLADEIEVDAKSGLQPGMAESMGAGCADWPLPDRDPGQR